MIELRSVGGIVHTERCVLQPPGLAASPHREHEQQRRHQDRHNEGQHAGHPPGFIDTYQPTQKPPIQGQRRSRRADLTSNCALKCRGFPLANVDGPLHRYLFGALRVDQLSQPFQLTTENLLIEEQESGESLI